jgi:hypothetical protein
MTVPLKHPVAAARAVRPDPLAVFIARAEARALLWHCLEIDLHAAVDKLWTAAVRDGLVAKLGTDQVQRLLADAFAPVRDDLTKSHAATSEPEDDEDTFARACRAADEKARRRRAKAEPPPRPHAAKATLRAAEYLVRENDPERLRIWLSKHTAQERAAIRKHLEARACR